MVGCLVSGLGQSLLKLNIFWSFSTHGRLLYNLKYIRDGHIIFIAIEYYINHTLCYNLPYHRLRCSPSAFTSFFSSLSAPVVLSCDPASYSGVYLSSSPYFISGLSAPVRLLIICSSSLTNELLIDLTYSYAFYLFLYSFIKYMSAKPITKMPAQNPSPPPV